MAEHDVNPEVLLADRGYDSDAIREDVLARGAVPEIPTKKNRRVQHSVNRALYRATRFFVFSVPTVQKFVATGRRTSGPAH